MPKRTKKSVLAQADRLASQLVRSVGRCDKCGSTQNLQAAHIYSRRFRGLRHDLRNLCCLCASCHWEAHQRPLEFFQWISETRPDDVPYLLEKSKESKVFSIHDYLEAVEELKAQLKEEQAA